MKEERKEGKGLIFAIIYQYHCKLVLDDDLNRKILNICQYTEHP